MARILLWPTYSYPGNVGADSLYLIARNLIRAAPVGEFVWTLVVPELGSVPKDDLDERPDVVKYPLAMPPLYRAQEALPDPYTVRLFAPQDGLYPVDALISMSPARTLSIADAWGIRTPDTARPLIVNWDLLVRDDGAGEIRASASELLLQAAGAAVADLNVHESPVARRMALDVVRTHLSAGLVRRVLDSSIDVLQGIPVARLDDAIHEVPKREKFTVYYGGRFSTSKRVNELAEVIDYFYRFGRDVEFVVTTGSLDGQKRAKFEERFPEAELHVGLSQEDAWRVMASCHASICFSSHELFGMAFWEQLAAGLAVVMKAERWNAELVPPEYPLMASNALEAGNLLRRIHDLGGWRTAGHMDSGWYGSPAAGWVGSHYDAGRNNRLLLDRLRSELGSRLVAADVAYYDGARRELDVLVRQALDSWPPETLAGQPTAGRLDPDAMPLDLLWILIRRLSRVGANVIGKKLIWPKSNATLDALRLARAAGWQDAIVDGEPGLRRKGA
jgi:glycosyltransferase involved in cell wall biosynthesis